jgi:hypothetical protein
MIMMRTEREINDLARERATKRSPPPAYDPIHAGWFGVVLTGLIVMTFIGLAGIPDGAHPLALGAVLGLGFLLPYSYLRNQQRLHDKAWVKEYTALRDRQVRKTGAHSETAAGGL